MGTTMNGAVKRGSRRLTNTNTDLLCCDETSPILNKTLYRFNLWTGLYMLNDREKIVYHLLIWFIIILFLVYVYVFLSGFKQGLLDGVPSIVDSTAAATEGTC